MLKRFSAMFLLLALVLQLVPALPAQTADAAATGYFTFAKESSTVKEARITTSSRVNLEGSISNLDPTSISYSVVQIVNSHDSNDPKDQEVGSKTEDVKGGIYVTGFNLAVNNVELYPGLNRITFKGMQGGAEVSSSIYITYRDSPVFYNLTARLDGNAFPMLENSTAVVQSATSRGRNSADIAITGNAPNAQKVTVEVNGSSRSYVVSASNNYEFTLSPLTINKGKNIATIKVTNNNQTVETTREITFYNGEVTFYDLKLNDETNSTVLDYATNFYIDSIDPAKMNISGTVIVPNNKKVVDGVTIADPDPTKDLVIFTNLDGLKLPADGIKAKIFGTYSPEDAFFIYTFSVPLNQLQTAYVYDHTYSLNLETFNTVAKETQGIYNLKFTLRYSLNPYVGEINYLPGYEKDMSTADALKITSKPLAGVNIYDTPLAMEVLIANYNDETIGIESIVDINGKPVKSADLPGLTDNVIHQVAKVNKLVNGVMVSYHRAILILDKLPLEGTQTVNLNLKSTGSTSVIKSGSVTFNMLFGPFLKYESIYDNQHIEYDTSKVGKLDEIISKNLSNFKGTLSNLTDLSDIRYAPVGTKPQTIFFYINNIAIGIEGTGADITTGNKFTATDKGIADAKEIMKSGGAFTLRFVYKGSKNNYENSITISLDQMNLPLIPFKPDTIYPYSSNLASPLFNDPNFPKKGSVYTTKESSMSISGTFDFLDLGQELNEVTVNAKDLIESNGYILKITGSTFSDSIIWTMNNELQIIDTRLKAGEQAIGVVNQGNTIKEIPSQGGQQPKLTVSYDLSTQSFSWVLTNQALNKDGTSSVYNFYVYNNGEAGPRSSYRLEVDPTAMPYTILRPLTSKRIVNQNYVEVIIDAPNAKTVTVNNQPAEKIAFDADNDGNVDYTTAYRVVVSGLKAGENKLKFTLASDNDKTNDTITVTYAPTNIPGAGYMEEMKSSHKVFEGELQLTFPKSTTLIRSDYNVPEKLKNQVFTGHRLLFGIANPSDGVVDRHEFEQSPANFDLILESLGNMFKNTFNTNFSKAGKVFWIDAGMADDPKTDNVNDPLKYGIDPYQFPTVDLPSYVDRPLDRELISSKQGSLTLSYDSNIVDASGTFITVFRFDPKKPEWVNLGGTVDTKKHTVTVPFSEFGYYVVGQLKYSYVDISAHPYARNYLEAMYAKGFMNPAGYDEFGANLYTTRGEFATMVVKAMGVRLNYDPDKRLFNDVGVESNALWDYRYIETAFNEGYIRGKAPKEFGISDNLTREDAAVILARALKLKLETDPAKIEKALQKVFKDYTKMSYYSRASVLAIYQKGYIQGSPIDSSDPKKGSIFEPQANLLRSDSAIILGKVLVASKKLPKIN